MQRNAVLTVFITSLFLIFVSANAQTYTFNTLAGFTTTGSNGTYAGPTLGISGTTLYGTTLDGATGNGSIYSVPVTGGTATTLATFNGSNGNLPYAGLTLSNDGSTLYGVASEGGSTYAQFGNVGDGVVYSEPTGGGSPTVLASFTGANGEYPLGNLLLVGTTLYGTTSSGGSGYTGPSTGGGTVFSIPAGGGSITTLASFISDSPAAGLTLVGNTFYGTTRTGGTFSHGSIFSIPVGGNSITTLASFSGSDGNRPTGGLTLIGNTFYGTTGSGGLYGNGTVFSIPVGGSNITTLADFNGTNGQTPVAGLTWIGSTLYGTTEQGGSTYVSKVNGGSGTVFSLPMSGGTPTTITNFTGSNGSYPYGELTASGSTLYGTTGLYSGGDGSVFSISVVEAAPEPSAYEILGLAIIMLSASALIARYRRN